MPLGVCTVTPARTKRVLKDWTSDDWREILDKWVRLPPEALAPAYEPDKRKAETMDALGSVLAERERQDAKWGEQNHNPYIYFAILLEEVGELAQAIIHTQFGGDKGGWKNVRMEAIHTAAVALAVIECLDRGKWDNNDVHFDYPDGK